MNTVQTQTAPQTTRRVGAFSPRFDFEIGASILDPERSRSFSGHIDGTKADLRSIQMFRGTTSTLTENMSDSKQISHAVCSHCGAHKRALENGNNSAAKRTKVSGGDSENKTSNNTPQPIQARADVQAIYPTMVQNRR